MLQSMLDRHAGELLMLQSMLTLPLKLSSGVTNTQLAQNVVECFVADGFCEDVR